MKLIPITLMCGAITLGACSSSGESTSLDPNAPVNDPAIGSITVGTSPQPLLETLPDIEFDGSANTASGEITVLESVSDDGAAEASIAATGSGTPSDSADGGSGDGGSAGAIGTDSADAGSTDAGASGSTDAATSDSFPTSADASSIPAADVIIEPLPEQFQPGTLTAADYDDQLNPHLYQSYASEYLQRVGGRLDVPYLDLSNRIALQVRDSAGQNYGGATLTISNDIGEIITLTTPASGRTYLYTDIDALPEHINIRATGLFGTALDATISLTDAKSSGIINISLPENQASPVSTRPATPLDVMFVVDTTGSMGDELNFLQTELTPIINAIPYNRDLLNIGLTFYRDIGDEYVVRSHGFTNDIGSAQQTLNSESFGGGGDYPEAMDQALHQAIDANWQPGSRRILFLIADAPPHGDKMRATWNAAEQARLNNIHIVPIAASGVGEDAEYIMRSMAAFTNSRYLFLTDDSGFGNPHAEPDVDCYVVTHLNNLMIRVMNSLITGVRDEPSDNEIIRRVGFYDGGVCTQLASTQ